MEFKERKTQRYNYGILEKISGSQKGSRDPRHFMKMKMERGWEQKLQFEHKGKTGKAFNRKDKFRPSWTIII